MERLQIRSLIRGSGEFRHPTTARSREEIANSTSVFVANVHLNATEDELRTSFRRFGSITNLILNTSRRYAFIQYKRREDAKRAIRAMDGSCLVNSSVKIRCSWGRMEQESQTQSIIVPRASPVDSPVPMDEIQPRIHLREKMEEEEEVELKVFDRREVADESHTDTESSHSHSHPHFLGLDAKPQKADTDFWYAGRENNRCPRCAIIVSNNYRDRQRHYISRHYDIFYKLSRVGEMTRLEVLTSKEIGENSCETRFCRTCMKRGEMKYSKNRERMLKHKQRRHPLEFVQFKRKYKREFERFRTIEDTSIHEILMPSRSHTQ